MLIFDIQATKPFTVPRMITCKMTQQHWQCHHPSFIMETTLSHCCVML